MVRCCVIEDSVRVRAIAEGHLQSFGFEVVGAGTAEEALALITSSKFDLVVLDWDLPNLEALDVLSGMAVAALVPKPITVLMAAENEPQQFALARAAGATHYMLKPFERKDLAEVVKKAGFDVAEAAA